MRQITSCGSLHSVLQGTIFFNFIFNVYVTGVIHTTLPRERENVMHIDV